MLITVRIRRRPVQIQKKDVKVSHACELIQQGLRGEQPDGAMIAWHYNSSDTMSLLRVFGAPHPQEM